MALHIIGDIGTNTTKTDGTSLTVTTNQAVPAVDVIIVGDATDPIRKYCGNCNR